MKKIGNFLILIGIICILCALSIFIYNKILDKKIINENKQVLDTLVTEIQDIKQNDFSDTYIEIDKNKYIGILEIESIDLSLPIIENCDNGNLDKAICLYANTENKIIAGHNRLSFFASLKNLKKGDKAIIFDIYGNKLEYTAEKFETIDERDSDKMIDSNYPLTLFTCNYNNTARYTIRFR